MIPIKTEMTNSTLKGPSPDVMDLPVTRFQYADDIPGVESCWQLSREEILKVVETGKIYFDIWGSTHPPILLSTESILGGDS
jgi:hypothetical protein